MKGVTSELVNGMYLMGFETYSDIVAYIDKKRPAQMTISFDGEKLTGAIPQKGYTVYEQVQTSNA